MNEFICKWIFDYNVILVVSRDPAHVRAPVAGMMRDLGMGRMAGERNICEEADKVMAVFESHQGRPFDPQAAINMAVSNIICSMVFGKQYAYSDERFQQALANLNSMIRQFSEPSSFLIILNPVFRFLLRSKFQQLLENYAGLSKFIMEEIAEHKEKFDGTIGDYIDAYLAEMETTAEKELFNGEKGFSLASHFHTSSVTSLDVEPRHHNLSKRDVKIF